jgi:HEPN domain-containing protein/predicted nucleotidyltransferase
MVSRGRRSAILLGVIQHAHSTDQISHEIVARITGVLRPWRIVLFGSRARGDARAASDYDVLVEIEGGDDPDGVLRRRVQDLVSACTASVDVHVRPPGEIERRRDDPGALEWDVARDGVVLYAAAPGPSIPARAFERPTDPPESLREWLEVAMQDLRLCRDLAARNDGYWAQMCFLAQQASEKHMKAALVAHRVRPPRTHDLIELVEQLQAIGCDLRQLDGECRLLRQHAVATRYPAARRLSEVDARAALAAAERVVAAVGRHLSSR